MGSAIFAKSGVQPVSENSLTSMKKRLADKMTQKPALAQMKENLANKLSSKTTKKSSGDVMKQFKELPAAKP